MTSTGGRSRGQNVGLMLGPILALLVLVTFDPAPDNPAVGRMAVIATLMATWWVTEAIPLAATSLLPMVLYPLLGLWTGTEIAGSYMNDIIFLYIGGFLIALGMERWNLHRRVALTMINAIGRRVDLMILGFMVTAAFLSMWISNTATAVMMLPIGLAIIGRMESEFGKERMHKLVMAILLGIAFSCSIGGVATLVGTPTNLAFLRIFQQTFPDAPTISFGQWFLVGLPLATIALLVAWVVFTKFVCRIDRDLMPDGDLIKRELRELGPVRYQERVVMVVWAVTAFLWVFRSDLVVGSFRLPGWSDLWSGFALIDDSTVAIFMALVLFVIPARSEGGERAILEVRAFKDLPWSAVLLFGGGFAMASGFVSSGLVEYLALQFEAMGELPLIVTLVLACVGVTLVTELVSNVATVQMFIPVLAAWAVAQEVNPLLLMVPATIVSSMAFLMPVATPPNAVIFGSDRVTIPEMMRAGVWIKAATVAITIFLVLVLVPVFFNADLGGFPEWAMR